MGYSVYPDYAAATWGVERWAGYGIPAECDSPECSEKIDRGLGFKCETNEADDLSLGEHRGGECMGCGMYFCLPHRYGFHREARPKPDSLEWETWMLEDESWESWRRENPKKVREMEKRQRDAR